MIVSEAWVMIPAYVVGVLVVGAVFAVPVGIVAGFVAEWLRPDEEKKGWPMR